MMDPPRTTPYVSAPEGSELASREGWLVELEHALLPLEEAPVECDGMTYAISGLLRKAGIPHTPMCGIVQDVTAGALVSPHCWIELPEGEVIDLRLRMWLGDDDLVPHGVFLPSASARCVYQGQPFQAEHPWWLLVALTDGLVDRVCLKHLIAEVS